MSCNGTCLACLRSARHPLHCVVADLHKALQQDINQPGLAVQIRDLRKRTDCLPDDYFVVLVGDMITEEALPTYMAMLNTLDGVRDETAASPSAWGR